MKQRATIAKTGTARVNFVSDTINELKKVTWLSRQEVIYLSGVVLLVTVAVGIVLGLIDFGFTQLINRLFLGS